MSASIHFATTYSIKYSPDGWLRDKADEFFDALNELGCDYLHTDGSDLFEVDKNDARKLLERLGEIGRGDTATVNGIRKSDIARVLTEAMNRGEPNSPYIHFFVF